MIIKRNYQNNAKPIDLIFRLEECMEREGMPALMETMKGLNETSLPREDYAQKLPEQLRNQPQRLLILWILLLMRYEKWRTIENYINAFLVSLDEDINQSLVKEARLWMRKELKWRIREKHLRTTMDTFEELAIQRKPYNKETHPEMWSFITNIGAIIYETHQ